MAGYAEHAARMDAEVDERLGDDILYKRPEDPEFVALKAFIFFDEPAEDRNIGARDSVKGKATLKIAKSLRRPHLDHRIKSSLLGAGEWRPIGKDNANGGRYWITDLQAV